MNKDRKTITVSEDVYLRLLKHGRFQESFNSMFERLLDTIETMDQ